MIELIIIFGALTLLAGVVILINPEVIFGYLRSNFDKAVIEILGWLSIVAALSLAAMGRHNFHRLMSWALIILKPYGRVGGVFAAVFGGFLIYAFV
jgi:hypothetical protein